MTPEQRPCIYSAVGLTGFVVLMIIILCGFFPITKPAEPAPCTVGTEFAAVLTDLYTANFYETENPRAKAALKRAIPALQELCKTDCNEDLKFMLSRLESLLQAKGEK